MYWFHNGNMLHRYGRQFPGPLWGQRGYDRTRAIKKHSRRFQKKRFRMKRDPLVGGKFWYSI